MPNKTSKLVRGRLRLQQRTSKVTTGHLRSLHATSKTKYVITNYTRKQAKKLGVVVKHSKNPTKKLDVFKDGVKISTCGGLGYNDYPTYWKKYGKRFADTRRKLYRMRHEKDRHIKGTDGYYADKLLW